MTREILTQRFILLLGVSLASCCSVVVSAWAFLPPEDARDSETPQSIDSPRSSSSPSQRAIDESPAERLPEFFNVQDLTGELEGLPRSEREVADMGLTYLARHSDWLQGVPVSQLKLSYVGIVPAVGTRPPMVYVRFIQLQQGLEIEGTYVKISVKLLNGRSVIMDGRGRLARGILLSQTAPLAPQLLEQQAQRSLGISSSARIASTKERRRIRYVGGRWRQVREKWFKSIPYRAVVDEQTGETWVEDDRVYDDIQGDVKGRGVLFDPSSTGTNLPPLALKDIEVRSASGGSAYTNTSGMFRFSDSTSPQALTITLSGRSAEVVSSPGDSLSFSAVAISGTPIVVQFNPSGAFQFPTAQTTAYYHTTLIHDYVRTHLNIPSIDHQLRVNVNVPEHCNAFYSPDENSINFFQASRRCVNTAYDTVIYHEYGHFVDDMAGGITGRALSEGWGDVFASFAAGQPQLGEGFLGPGTYVRTADNTYQYLQDGNFEVHHVGQAWAGFAWHLREELVAHYGQTEGVRLAESLIFPVILANSSNIPEAAFETLLLDDDDGDLSNGTPHMEEILHAAQRHSIPVIDLKAQLDSPPGKSHTIWVPALFVPKRAPDISIWGTVQGTELLEYQLLYGRGSKPSTWLPTGVSGSSPTKHGLLGKWSIGDLPEGIYSARLIATSRRGDSASDEAIFELNNSPLTLLKPIELKKSLAINGPAVPYAIYLGNNSKLGLILANISVETRVEQGSTIRWSGMHYLKCPREDVPGSIPPGHCVYRRFVAANDLSLYGSGKFVPGPATVVFNFNGPYTADLQNLRVPVTLIANTGLPPKLTVLNRAALVGQPLAFSVSATDPNYSSLTFAATSLPPGAVLDATSGIFSWTPKTPGTYPVTFTATNAFGLTDSRTAILVVLSGTAADNVLSNGGFESGGLDWLGWGKQARPATGIAYGGTSSATLTLAPRNPTWVVHRLIPVVGGLRYRVSAFIKTVNIDPDKIAFMDLLLFDAKGKQVGFWLYIGATTATTNWIEKLGLIDAPPEATQAKVSLEAIPKLV